MPLQTREYDLEETLEEKREDLEDVAEQAAELDPENPAFQRLAQEGNDLETYIAGLEWAVENWDVDTIMLGGMTGGEVAKMENELANDGTGMGDARIATVVHGTVEAPYLSEDEARTYANVGQLPYHLQAWIEDEVNQMTMPGNSETTFGALLEEKRLEAAGTESSGSSGS